MQRSSSSPGKSGVINLDPAGMPQIGRRYRVGNVVCDVALPRRYELSFASTSDTICLIFGDLDAVVSYDEERERPKRFGALTVAWHPPGGHVRVAAHRVAGGFAAFTYAPGFREHLVGDEHVAAVTVNIDNLSSPAVVNLAAYAGTALGTGAASDPLTVEMLAGLTYMEALRSLGALGTRTSRRTVSNRDITRLTDHIEDRLGEDLSLAELARTIDVPVATLSRAFKLATGRTLHRYILERRVVRARAMLSMPGTAVADVAYACGFSSQQHMTAVFSEHVGLSPAQYRKAVSPGSTAPAVSAGSTAPNPSSN